MRPAFIQLASDVIEQGAVDLAVMLDWDELAALGGLVHLFKWALARCPDDEPPSANDVIHGPAAAKLVARAAGYQGDAEAFVDACERMLSPVLERVSGGIRVRGLDRYDSYWGKCHPEAWKQWRARPGSAPEPEQNRPGTSPEPSRDLAEAVPEPPPEPEQNRPEAVSEPARISIKKEVETTPPRACARESSSSSSSSSRPSLLDELVGAWRESRQSELAVSFSGEVALRKALEWAGGDEAEVLRRWRHGLTYRRRFPRALGLADLGKAEVWNAWDAPEPAAESTGPPKRSPPQRAAPPSGACTVPGCEEPAPKYFCDRSLCYPHIGAARAAGLTYRDGPEGLAKWIHSLAEVAA